MIELTPETAREFLGRSKCGRPNAQGHPCGLSRSYRGLPCSYHQTDEDHQIVAFIEEVRRIEMERWERRQEDDQRIEKIRAAESLVGRGEMTRESAQALLRGRRHCGRVSAWFPDQEPCTDLVFPFAAACRTHMTPAEQDAWLLADEAHRLGREEGRLVPQEYALWNGPQIRRRIKLKGANTACSVERHGYRCTNTADEFSDKCTKHMDVAERNAVALASAAARREEQRWWTPEKAASLSKAQQRRNQH